MTPEEEYEYELAMADAEGAPEPRPEPVSNVNPVDPRGVAGTAARSGAKGASYGFADELGGLSGALQEVSSRGPLQAGLVSSAANLAGPGIISNAANFGMQRGERPDLPTMEAALLRYRSDRDRMRKEQEAGARRNPKTAFGAELVGAVAAPGPKVASVGGLPLTRTGASVASGALQGAVAGAGGSKAEQPIDIAKDAALMAAMGGVANPVVGGLARAAGAGLEKLGITQALKALGGRAGITDSLARAGIETAEEGQQLAKRALDEGLVRPFRTAEDVARQAAEKQQFGANPVLEDVMSRANQGQPFDFDEAAWEAANKLMTRKRAVPGALNPQEQKTGSEAMRMVKRIAGTEPAEGAGSFSEANRLKQDMYDAINWRADAPLSTEMQRKAASGLRESIEKQAGRNLGPEDAEALKAANERWGFAQTVKDIATEEARRQAQRQVPWLKIAGGAAAAGAPGAIAGSLVGSPRLTSAAAVGAYGTGKALKGALGELVAGGGRSIVDPMGSLRQYLGLSPEERRQRDAEAFMEGQ